MKTILLPISLGLFIAVSASVRAGSEPFTAVPADAALAELVAGNHRFASGATNHPDQSVERRAEVAKAQHPIAVVVACADSRLSPELIFDQGLGTLFVIRNAGNVLDDHVLGSIEYAVEHLHTALLIVLGHTQCGAVTAAVAGTPLPGHLSSIMASLAPAVEMARKKPGDAVDNAVRINARLEAESLTHAEPIVAEAVRAGQVKVVAARYDLTTGRVEFFP